MPNLPTQDALIANRTLPSRIPATTFAALLESMSGVAGYKQVFINNLPQFVVTRAPPSFFAAFGKYT